MPRKALPAWFLRRRQRKATEGVLAAPVARSGGPPTSAKAPYLHIGLQARRFRQALQLAVLERLQLRLRDRLHRTETGRRLQPPNCSLSNLPAQLAALATASMRGGTRAPTNKGPRWKYCVCLFSKKRSLGTRSLASQLERSTAPYDWRR